MTSLNRLVLAASCIFLLFEILFDSLLLDSYLPISDIIRSRVGHILHGVRIKLLCHYVQLQPDVLVVTLFEGVQLAIIGTSIRVNLRLLVPFEHASHGPLAVYKATISHHQILRSAAAWAPKNAICYILFHLEDVVASVNDD